MNNSIVDYIKSNIDTINIVDNYNRNICYTSNLNNFDIFKIELDMLLDKSFNIYVHYVDKRHDIYRNIIFDDSILLKYINMKKVKII